MENISIFDNPFIQWIEEDSFLSPHENESFKKNLISQKTYTHVVMLGTNSDKVFMEKDHEQHQELLYVSTENLLEKYNIFDLPLGCQHPTFFQLHVLSELVQHVFLPENDILTTQKIIQYMYHQLEITNSPKVCRSDHQLYAKILHHFDMNFHEQNSEQNFENIENIESDDLNGKPWFEISYFFLQKYNKAHHEEDLEMAYLCHYQAMPTVKDLEKCVKDLGNYTTTADGYFIPPSLGEKTRKICLEQLNGYGPVLGVSPTEKFQNTSVFLELCHHQAMVHKTRTVERLLCTLLMIYRHFHDKDVIENNQKMEYTLYMSNLDYDYIYSPYRKTVELFYNNRFHKIKNDNEQNALIWNEIDLPLSNPYLKDIIFNFFTYLTLPQVPSFLMSNIQPTNILVFSKQPKESLV